MSFTLTKVAVIGAGTMGMGIAEVFATAGYPVQVLDISPEAYQRAETALQQRLTKQMEKGRLDPASCEGILARITPIYEMEQLVDVELVIEAAAERMDIKRDIFARLDAITSPQAIIASNTSSIPITSIAAATKHPERVIGLHFFNPAPLMSLVEVVMGAETESEHVTAMMELMQQVGKEPVRVKDAPGFLVNRVARPFHLEAYRLLDTGIAKDQIDRIIRSAGFKMGPFELQDLIGIDINFAASESVYEGFFQEPRFRPHFLQKQMVERGALGRKTGRGHYEYSKKTDATSARTSMVEKLDGWLTRPVILIGKGPLFTEMDDYLTERGLEVFDLADPSIPYEDIQAVIDVSTTEEKRTFLQLLESKLLPSVPIFSSVLHKTATEIASWLQFPKRIYGFSPLMIQQGACIEMSQPLQAEGEERWLEGLAFWERLGKQVEVVADEPGLVFPRILALLVNEAAFAQAEGIANMEDIDLAMRKGTNYPHGPFAWADQVGIHHIVAILTSLQQATGGERFCPAPLLRRMVQAGYHGKETGRGFYSY